jgi:uncharacterized protein YbjT (DUF2867 family)
MYAVIGATGNTGSVVVEKLLAKGEKVRAIGRHAERLQPFAARGAEPFVANAEDVAALTRAFAGAEAVYAMIPPNMSAPDFLAYSKGVGDALAAAIEKSGVKNVVVLSSFGADKPEKTGPVVGLHRLEENLNAIPGLNALYLRPGYFMENLLPQVGVIKSFGLMAGPVKADLRLPLIATRDIGAAAAESLLKLDFEGKRTHELLGERDINYSEIAEVVGKAIGKPGLMYQKLPAMQLKPALMQMGMSASLADGLLEMSDALNSGHMRAIEPRSAANTTPTKLETWVAEVFVPAFRGQSVGA